MFKNYAAEARRAIINAEGRVLDEGSETWQLHYLAATLIGEDNNSVALTLAELGINRESLLNRVEKLIEPGQAKFESIDEVPMVRDTKAVFNALESAAGPIYASTLFEYIQLFGNDRLNGTLQGINSKAFNIVSSAIIKREQDRFDSEPDSSGVIDILLSECRKTGTDPSALGIIDDPFPKPGAPD